MGKAHNHANSADARKPLTFDAVPAWVCMQCGEVYFEDTEIEAIQEVIHRKRSGLIVSGVRINRNKKNAYEIHN